MIQVWITISREDKDTNGAALSCGFSNRQQRPKLSVAEAHNAPAVPVKKRVLIRQYDSGVLLGSDMTDGEETPDRMEFFPEPRSSQLNKRPVPVLSQPELAMREMICKAVDCSDEALDFWNLGLTEYQTPRFTSCRNLSGS